jgi:hypothetical protein
MRGWADQCLWELCPHGPLGTAEIGSVIAFASRGIWLPMVSAVDSPM